jgi:hypothetical protein
MTATAAPAAATTISAAIPHNGATEDELAVGG